MRTPGFKFAKVPTERHPEWFDVSLECRCLGLELYVSILDWRTGIAEVAVTERWAVSLCKLLRVEPEDRRAACRMLEALERRGLLVIENGKARVVFRADEELGPRKPDPRKPAKTSEQGQSTVNQGSEWGQSGVNRHVSNGNDSTHVLQREEIEERENARAKPELRAVEPETGWIRLGKHYQALFDAEQEGTRNPRPYDEQRIVSVDAPRFQKLLELVNAEAARSGNGAKQIFEAATLAFLRDPRQRAKGFVLEFFARDFTHYVDQSLEAAS